MDAKKFNKLIKHIDNCNAFKVLYDELFPQIVAHIFFKFRNKHICEDVAHSFFVKLLNRDSDEYIEKPLAWIYKISDNIACDMLNDEKKYNLAYREADLHADEAFESVLFGDFRQVLNELDEVARDIIIKFYLEGYSLKEIAEMKDMNYNTVRQKCARGIKSLKNSIKM